MGTNAPAPCLADFIARLDALLRASGDEQVVGPGVMEAMTRLLEAPDLLRPEQRVGDPGCYTRHLLHADPEGRFTAFALVWQPGQASPIHGHTAWCAVGVYEGEATETAYELPTGSPEGQGTPQIARETRHSPGSVLLSRTGVHGIHRIANHGERDLVSIHVYGRDLRQDPGAINVLYAEPGCEVADSVPDTPHAD